MMKRYNYFINGNKTCRKDFITELKVKCRTAMGTHVSHNGIGVDLCMFDEKKFNRNMRAINHGTVVVIGHFVFSRKEVK